MRHQDANPLHRELSHLLPESGHYPAKWVDIVWNVNDEGRIEDVEAVFVPPYDENTPEGAVLWVRYHDWRFRHWSYGMGACCEGWLEPDNLAPGVIFGGLLREGFASYEEMRNAVREFAWIEECEWAREMLAPFGLDQGWRA
jgi:hypothetical protein